MTAQITDTFIFKGEQQDLICICGGPLATPQHFGMVPSVLASACYDSFYSTYELTEKHLFLRNMPLKERGSRYLPTAGVAPDLSKPHQATYTNIAVHDPITELCVQGYQEATAFKSVYDITLLDGKITRLTDRSAEMAAKRGKFKREYEAGDMEQTMEDAFSLVDLE